MALIGEAVVKAINSALVDGHPVVVCYQGLDGRPHASFRGSVQVLSPCEVGIWLRASSGGLADAVAVNPALTFLYHNAETRELVHLYGDARLDAGEEIGGRLWAMMPERERERDPERRGAPLVVEIVKITYGPAELPEPPVAR